MHRIRHTVLCIGMFALIASHSTMHAYADPTIIVNLDLSTHKPRLIIEHSGLVAHEYPIAAPKITPSCIQRGPVTGTVTGIDTHARWRPTERTKRAALKKGLRLKDVYSPTDPGNALAGRKLLIRWDADCIPQTVRIHGTTDESSVRRQARVSRGCIRMLNSDWDDLITRITPGTPVRIVWRY